MNLLTREAILATPNEPPDPERDRRDAAELARLALPLRQFMAGHAAFARLALPLRQFMAGHAAFARLALQLRQVLAGHAAFARLALQLRQVLASVQAHHDERTLGPDAPKDQVMRVISRWRKRFRVYPSRRAILKAVAREQGRSQKEILGDALVVGVLHAWAWRRAEWDRLGPLPATYVDRLVRTVVLREADRYLRSVERDAEAVQSSIRLEDLSWTCYQRPAEERTAPDTGPPAAATARWRAVLAQAGPAQRRLLEAWYAQPDATLAEIARAVGTTEKAADQAIRRLQRRLG